MNRKDIKSLKVKTDSNKYTNNNSVIISKLKYRYDFSSYLNNAKYRSEKKSFEPIYIREQILRLNKYVRRIKAENPNMSFEQLQGVFNKDYEEIVDTFFNNGYILDYSMAYAAGLYFLNHQTRFRSILSEYSTAMSLDNTNSQKEQTVQNSIDNSERYPDSYSSNFDENLRVFVKELKSEYDNFMNSKEFDDPSIIKLKDILLDSSIPNSEKNKTCNSMISRMSYNARIFFKKYIDCVKGGEYAFLRYHIETLKNDLNFTLLKSISSVFGQLQKFGFADKYPECQEKALNSIDIFNFVPPLESTKKQKGLDLLANPNYLSTLSLEKLLALNNAWFNRYIKEMDTYFESIYSIEQLNLLPQMFDGSLSENSLSVDSLKSIFFKMNVLYKPSLSFWNYARGSGKDTVESYPVEGKEYYMISSQTLSSNLKKFAGEEYKEYFDSVLPNVKFDNDISKDLDLYWKVATPIMNGYHFKDLSILSTIALTEALSLSQNYGIVLNREGFHRGECNPNTNLNFWIDFKGINFPIREHIPLWPLKKYWNEYNGNSMVPLYLDPGAFTGIKSHVVYPYTKEQISFLKSAKSSNFAEYSNPKTIRFLNHSNFLVNPSKQAKKTTSRLYLNLDDLRVYTLRDDGEYEPYVISPKHEKNMSIDSIERDL